MSIIIPFPRRRATTLSGVLLGAVRAVFAPAPVASRAAVMAPVVAEPANLFAAGEIPAVDVIEAAAADFERAAELARRADRGKRAARKILDRLPAGRYGAWTVERVESAREVADLEAIRAVFAAHGLGPVPMKPCAPSLKVARVQAASVRRSVELVAA
jgi:hypothetical protein